MARVLVIGGTLFLGRALVEELLRRGVDVTVMHRGRGTPWGERVRELRCDRNDVAAVRASLADARFDVVFDNVYDWERGTTADQVMAAVETLREGLQRYVFTSSVAAHGGSTDEDADFPQAPLDHPDPYGRNKAETERALFAFQRERGVPVTTLRPAFIYGPHNPMDRESFFWDRILAGRPVIIPGDGSRLMQWVHVEDVANAAIVAAHADAASGHGYNLGGEPITQLEFVQALARAAGRELQPVHVPREIIHEAGGNIFAPPLYFGTYLDIPPLTVKIERLRRDLGLELRPLDDGLRETFAWYQAQRRPRPDFSWEDRLLATAR